MLTPDSTIVKKVKEYDPDLYIVWNNKKQYFELWRSVKDTNVRLNQKLQDQLITPITQSIYNTDLPKTFVQLDERILYWIFSADSHKQGGSKMMWLQDDLRWQEFNKKAKVKAWEKSYDKAKDLYCDINNFYTGDVKVKRGRAKFENYKEKKKFLRPDSVSNTSSRVFARSTQNAKLYNYKGKS